MPSSTDEVHGLLSADWSGVEFWKLARQAGLKREEVHITAAMLCRPKRVKADGPVAAYACTPRLAQELASLPADVPIVPLGTIAESILTGHANIAKGRGFIWRVPQWVKKSRPKRAGRPQLLWDAQYAVRTSLAGRVVMPTLDPRQVVRAQPTWLELIGRDLRRVARWLEAGGLPLEDEGTQLVCRTPGDLAIELADWRPGGGFGSEVVVDVETAGKDPLSTELLMVGICDVTSGLTVQAYPWTRKMGPILAAFLKDRTVVTHNGPSFDEIVLARYGVTYTRRADTLVMHHALASHLRQSLDHCAANYCDAAPWKLRYRGQTADDKGGFGVKSEDLPTYNGADVRLSRWVWTRMSAEISDEDRRVYEIDLRLADVARRMRERGLGVDEGRRQALIKACCERENGLLASLRQLTADASFEPSKARAIRGVLYRNQKARSWTPTGEASTDKGALEEMIVAGGPEGEIAHQVLAWRSARDARTEYLEALDVRAGRVHASWRLPSTETGRPACKAPNLLNMARVPHCAGCGVAMLNGCKHCGGCSSSDLPDPAGQIRDVYVAKKDHVFVYFDLSQAEMRLAAHIYADGPMMQACQGDVHAGNASVVFPEHAATILADPKGKGKAYRDIAKNVGFAIAYLAQANTVHAYLNAHGFHVDIETVTRMLERLHVAYKHYYAWVDYQYRHVKRYGYLRSVWSGRKRTFGKLRISKPEVANYQIQAGVADIMNNAILHFDAVLSSEAGLVMYAYDALVYETPMRLADEVKAAIVERWRQPLRVPAWPASGLREIEFVQPIDVHIGERLSEL